MQSFKRATTTSFGSICLGSLIVAVLKTLRTLVQGARRQNDNIIAYCADCILGILDSLIQYFNMYAFTQVAIYGKTFCQAAKDTWSLIHSHGIEAIVNDNLVSPVLFMSAFIGGCATGIVAGVMGFVLLQQYWIACAVTGFIIGFMLLIMVTEVVESGVATIFVCFAMDPEALRRNDEFLYSKFRDTYNLSW